MAVTLDRIWSCQAVKPRMTPVLCKCCENSRSVRKETLFLLSVNQGRPPGILGKLNKDHIIHPKPWHNRPQVIKCSRMCKKTQIIYYLFQFVLSFACGLLFPKLMFLTPVSPNDQINLYGVNCSHMGWSICWRIYKYVYCIWIGINHLIS